MTSQLTVLTAREVNVSKLIEVNIPHTNDLGDALHAAATITAKAFSAVVREHNVSPYASQSCRIRNYVAAAHLDYLKGGR
jgi:hypothetical protein